MAYKNLPGVTGVRARLERRNHAGEEQIALITATSPYVDDIVKSRALLDSAIGSLRDRLLGDDTTPLPEHHPEVIMFHGCYVRTLVWCAQGACSRIGIQS